MGMILNNGAFFAATMEEIRGVILEEVGDIEALLDKLLGFGALSEPEEIERAGWQNAASFSIKKAAARAQAYARLMMDQKARQVMKRRKLKHADGCFPDWGCGS